MKVYCIIHSVRHSRIYCYKCRIIFCVKFKNEHNAMCDNNKFKTKFYVSKLVMAWDGTPFEKKKEILVKRRIRHLQLDKELF